MGKIGEHCKELVDLNISGTPITDRGLIQLCVSEYGERRCQKLARLVVNETWVTSAGASVVLQSLPNLREFDFDNIFEVSCCNVMQITLLCLLCLQIHRYVHVSFVGRILPMFWHCSGGRTEQVTQMTTQVLATVDLINLS